MENMIFIKLEEYEEMKNKIFIQKQMDMEEFKKSCKLEQRINKAMEYIELKREKNKSNYDCEILNILRGEDNEE